MARDSFKNFVYQGDVKLMTIALDPVQISINEKIVMRVLQELLNCGVRDICVCSGKRNAPFIAALDKIPLFNQYFWPEERSAAFFALGRSKLTRRPAVVLTTSGTAVGELLPAAMEAFYTGVPLILLTADRPRSFRGSGAPQSAEQVGLFGPYAVIAQDIAGPDECDLKDWKQNGPVHLNVCLDEPLTQKFEEVSPLISDTTYQIKPDNAIEFATKELDQFICSSHYPFVVVSAIEKESREAIVHFLQTYQAPVYLEAVSGLREDPRLSHLRIIRTEQIWKAAKAANYPIDGILRIGGVPTFRLWRDLEDLEGQIQLCSISSQPFSGVFWGKICHTQLEPFFSSYGLKKKVNRASKEWKTADQQYWKKVLTLFDQEPQSEAALVYHLSQRISDDSFVYLGNSLPIREWDAYATGENPHPEVSANRGVNGIDGQISTFLGMCSPNLKNWGMIGDLTAIYDLAGPWILDQMQTIDLNLVIINNGGGKFFARMFPQKQIQNPHGIRFKSLAELWKMHYECYTCLPDNIPYGGHRIIEILPNEESTMRFWNEIEGK